MIDTFDKLTWKVFVCCHKFYAIMFKATELYVLMAKNSIVMKDTGVQLKPI